VVAKYLIEELPAHFFISTRTEDGTLQILSVPSHFSQAKGMFEETEFEAWNYYGRLLTLILCI
jgi:hypothetical protein